VWPRPIGVGLSSDPGPLAWPAVVASVPTRYLNVTIGDRSRANHAHSYPNNPVRRHILAAKLRAPRGPEPTMELRRQGPATALRRQEPARCRLAALHKPGLHRPAVLRKPVEVPAPELRVPLLPSRRPMRRSLKKPKRPLRERELSSFTSPRSALLYGCRARFNEDDFNDVPLCRLLRRLNFRKTGANCSNRGVFRH
jgi:hypothetical protein